KHWPHNQRRWPRRLMLVAAIVVPLIAVAGVAFVWAQQRARRVEVSGSSLRVPAGGDLQGALDRARPGDTIFLAAGATYTGTFNLPNKPGSEFIVIRSDAPDA